MIGRRLAGIALASILILGSAAPVRPASDPLIEDRMLNELKEKAARRGVVRVIAEVRPADDAPDAVERAKERLDALMRASGTAVQVEPLEDLPYVVLEVTAEGLDRLLASGLVRRLQEDSPAAPQ